MSRKCKLKVMGDNPISGATAKQLRAIEKCAIKQAGGKPNPKVFGKDSTVRSTTQYKNLSNKMK